ncbi:MAG: TetR family transcriptional regulator C-terminal domain-containing protein [Acidobacteriota bacterium]
MPKATPSADSDTRQADSAPAESSRGSSKERLLEAGRDLFWHRGFHNVGLAEILAQASVPKGSFYHHFKSKEDFGAAVIDSFGERALSLLENHLSAEGPHLLRLRAFFLSQRVIYRRNGCQEGCLLGNLGQELADSSEALRLRVDRYLGLTTERFERCLEEARREGELPGATDPASLASVLYSGWHGALLRMKVCKSLEPVDAFLKFHFPTSAD